MTTHNGGASVGFTTPEALHTDLTDIFLHEYADGLSHIPNQEAGVSSQYLAINLDEKGEIQVRDMTPAYHESFKDPAFKGTLLGQPTVEMTSQEEPVFLTGTRLRPYSQAHEMRQRSIYFLQAHQGFFELVFRGYQRNNRNKVLEGVGLGTPSHTGPNSANTRFAYKKNADQTEVILGRGDSISPDTLDNTARLAHERARKQSLIKPKLLIPIDFSKYY